MTRDPFASLEALIDLGVDRILTSGQASSVPDGMPLIAELVERAGDRVTILPGAGIHEHNLREVIDRTGAIEAHFTASVVRESGMLYRNPDCRMGTGTPPGEYDLKSTDAARVRAFVQALASD